MPGLAGAVGPKAHRTSKTTQKLVLLPSAPQTKPFREVIEDNVLGYETDAGVRVREYKNPAERMNKEQRERAGYKRITAYCVCEAMRMKLLASFLKREHNVQPRVFDEAMYVVSLSITDKWIASLDGVYYLDVPSAPPAWLWSQFEHTFIRTTAHARNQSSSFSTLRGRRERISRYLLRYACGQLTS